MPSDLAFGPPTSEDERIAFMNASAYAFWPNPQAEPDLSWLDSKTTDDIRLARRDGTVIGGAFIMPDAQYFGGKPVPSALIGAVSVLPHHRSGGVGTAIVGDYLRESRRRGLAISTLYPASYAVYRRTGYEIAGINLRYDIQMTDLAGVRREETGITIRVDDGDGSDLRALYGQVAAGIAGHVGRNDQRWAARQTAGKTAVFRFRAERDGDLVGALIFTIVESPRDHRRRIVVRDWLATDRAVNRALIAFLAGHRGTVASVEFWGGAGDWRLLDVPHAGVTASMIDPWMLRIVDLEAALTARGYLSECSAEIDLDVVDDLLPENAGRWVLRVGGGAATVERGGDGRVMVTSRGLAPVYTGSAPAERVRDPDLLDGPDSDLALLTAIFANPAPWLNDQF